LRVSLDSTRLLFPVHSRNGDFHGYVGRDITGHARNKYYNYFSLETAYVLGGMQHYTRDITRILIVEGYFDLLGLARWTQGTNVLPICTFKAELHEIQAKLLLGLDCMLDFWYDPDSAGQAGYERAATTLNKLGGVCTQTKLPEGVDPHKLNEPQFTQLLNRY
jgi:DNA primase